MKRCPSCNRTYTDDTMTNCAHDGAPLMAAAYSPQGAPMIPPPQPHAPPVSPTGYPPQPPHSLPDSQRGAIASRRRGRGALKKRPPRPAE